MRAVRSRKVIDRIRSLRLKGFGCRLIGKELGVSPSFVYGVLKDLSLEGFGRVWRCPFCGKKLIVKKNGTVGGHIGQHIRRRSWHERDWVKAIRLWKEGLRVPEISVRTGISQQWLRVGLRRRLGKVYLRRRWKRG
jgi:DNA-directed RNA polymerase subunit RPC12/RpoP